MIHCVRSNSESEETRGPNHRQLIKHLIVT